ncbi:NAD(P)/FAD-dependent oxidoreductase [bacterium]|nr:NAD(P)/FAD-dependent oxidoreductase [bacterium]
MLVVIGGGPAGFFAAIRAREIAPDRPLVLLERGGRVLRKVAVSGGGRCNVTHACFDPRELVTRYPRGGRELRGPLHGFGPGETVAWFAARGVELKTEDDGRMFPVTDSSATIVEALERAAREAGVAVRTRAAVASLAADGPQWRVELADGDPLVADAVLLATGGQAAGAGVDGLALAAGCGHTVVPPVPSLFTLNIADPLPGDLAGVSVPAGRIRVPGAKALTETGPILITHWGLSGPAVLRLSAWGARHFADHGYELTVEVNWTGDRTPDAMDAELQATALTHGRQAVRSTPLAGLPRRLWAALADAAGLDPERRWGDLGKAERRALAVRATACPFAVEGLTSYKEEFVTCGGVALPEVDFRNMASRVAPGLFLAGEVLDVDGVTGGFNFQNCWTTGWLAGAGLASHGAST